jgi:hypothetical protein
MIPNNRAEQSQSLPHFMGIKLLEHVMRRFKSVKQVQNLLDTYAAVSNHFNLGSYLVSVNHNRNLREDAFKD